MIEQYLNNINLLPKVSGVYSIVNVLNGNRYIGSSMNIHQRAAESFGYRNGRFWIKDCILGKRQEAFGFKWRYSNDK